MNFSFLLLFVVSSTAFAAGPGGTFRDVYGPEYRRQVPAPNNESSKIASDVVHRWNQIAIDATGLDDAPGAPGETRVVVEHVAPGAGRRDMGSVRSASLEAHNALVGGYISDTGVQSSG